MSWMSMLNKTYENVMKDDTCLGNLSQTLLPLAHSTQNAQIEVCIGIDGEFINAEVVDKENGEEKNLSSTLIPVTEASASRGNGVLPHPLCDKLQYVARDFYRYDNVKGDKYYKSYINGLREWSESSYSHEKVKAIYQYLSSHDLIAELIHVGVLFQDKSGKLMKKWNGNKEDMPKIFKVVQGLQSDSFVRFSVSGGKIKATGTWEDETLHKTYIQYYLSKQKDKSLCYVTGDMVACSMNHPSKIRNTGDKAKLLSANDTSGFTFRGRFESPDQAAMVGYETSQNAHNALKWLISKQGRYFGEKVFILWGTQNEDTPDLFGDTDDFFSHNQDKSVFSYTKEDIAKKFNQAVSGYKAKITAYTNLSLMAVDAATTGRMSITFYREYYGMEGNELIERVEKWHRSGEWYHQYKFNYVKENPKEKFIRFWGMPSLKDIILIAYGTEQNGNITISNKKVVAQGVERLLPCVCDEKRIPKDIVNAVVNKAFHPQCYSEEYNWRKVMSVACSLEKKYRSDYYNEEDWTVEGNCDSKDINYNCGRLLAVADSIERWALQNDDSYRPTTAIRLFARFSQRPCETWAIINQKLAVYKTKLGSKGSKYYNMLSEISSQIDDSEFANAKHLDGRMALGFDSQQYAIRQMILEMKVRKDFEKNNDIEEEL